MTATSRCHHVATSPSRDVGSTNAEVNNSATSRRHHVATSPRRDVSSKICISSLNARGLEKEGHREAYDERHGFQEPEDPDFESFPGIRTVFRFC